MKIIEKEFNLQTNEEIIIEREETAAETKARLDYKKANEAALAAAEIKATEKAALLAKLGITYDEVKLLLS